MADPAVFDHFEVLRREDGSLHELGRGAMGITYKAFDTNLRCHVALKVINGASIDSETARQRFIREARAAAQLRHRHVASVFHLGIEGETYFYAMEYIEGETLESLIRRSGPLDPALALQITTQVARALNAAQKHQLVHRDIKPSNLMLVQEDEELVVKVIDFGLAKSSRKDDSEETATISMGGFVGTPHFASPEQLEERELDVRSDLYSLGITLWYMLVGQVPFGGSLAQVMSQHLHAPPPVEQLTRLSPPLQTLLARLLEKDPADRPQTPLELRAELEKCRAVLAAEPAGASLEVPLPTPPAAAPNHETLHRIFQPGTVVAGRYDIVEDLGEEPAGWAFLARDREAPADVRLLVLPAEISENPTVLTQLEREVSKLQIEGHPHLLAVLGMERIEPFSFLVLARTNGFSLLEVLRARRELGVNEVLPLVQQIAEGLDFVAQRGLRQPDLSLHQIALHFEDPNPPEPELAVTRWPAFAVKLNALGLNRAFATSDTWAGGQTIVGRQTPAPGESHAGLDATKLVSSLAALLYELLGGTLSPATLLGTSARYSPLAGLSEEGNALLKNALEARPAFDSAQTFFLAFQQAAGAEPARQRAAATTPSASPGGFEIASEPPAFQPQKKPTAPVAIVVSISALALAVAAGVWLAFKQTSLKTTVVTLRETPAPAPTATPPLSIAATPAPQTPAPADEKLTALRSRVAAAEQAEAAENWSAALAAYAQLARDFPESEIGKIRLELLLAERRAAFEKMDEAAFAPFVHPLTDAAQLNVVSAMMILGSHLRKSAPREAFNWFCAAAALGQTPALVQVGLMYSNGAGVPRDFAKAAEWFQLASDQGEAAGKTCLAECYLYGRGVRRDEQRAVEILQDAVTGGDPRAMNLLGTCYHQGLGTAKNFEEARRLFTQARELKFGDATGNLGVLYINGDGVPKDVPKALELFRQGARNGNAFCMFLLARCLESGIGLDADPERAASWYQKSATAGDPRAIEWCRKNNLPIPPK